VRSHFLPAILSVSALGAATALLHAAGVTYPTTIALSYLLVVLFIAAAAHLWFAAVASVLAALLFNFFFLPPVGTLQLADPANWIVLASFLIVSIVASQLSASARAKAQEALDRRNSLSRLFDVTRDILLTTERDGAFPAIARQVARRFELDVVGICLPAASGGWEVNHGGASAPDLLSARGAERDKVAALDAGADYSTCSYSSPSTPGASSRTARSSRPSGGPTPSISPSICGCSSTRCGGSSSCFPPVRSTF